MLLGLGLTFVVWRGAALDAQDRQRERFQQRVDEIMVDIGARLKAYEQVLHGTAGLIAASPGVSRSAFKTYVDALRLERNYPGIQGLGYSLLVPAHEKAGHEQRIRQEGFPDYRIHPEGHRDILTAIVYLEPFDWRNRRAFGFDMFSEPVRRAAMARAWEQGVCAISGKVTLLQETERETQAGFLMYLPVYRPGLPLDDVEQRRAGLLGWAYAAFRMDDLMRGVLHRHFDTDSQSFLLEVFDGAETAAASRLYRGEWAMRAGSSTPVLKDTRQMLFAGRTWTVVVLHDPSSLHVRNDRRLSAIVISGVLGSLMLAMIMWLLIHGQRRARAVAARMNHDLLENERYQQALLAQLPVAIVVHAPDTAIRYCNRMAAHLLGLREEEAGGQTATDDNWHFLREDGSTMPPEQYPVNLVLASLAPLNDYLLGILPPDGGAARWVLVSAFPYLDADGGVDQVVVTFLDITSRRTAEARLRKAMTEMSDLYDHAPCGYHSLDAQGRLVRVNQTELDWLGYRREDMLGKPFTEFVTPAGLATFQKNYPLFKERGYVKDLEFDLLRRDGSILSVLLNGTAICDVNGQFLMSRSTLFDITARKQAEVALAETRAELQHIVDVSPSAIYRVYFDPEGERPPRVDFINRKIIDVVGYTREDWDRTGFWEDCIHPDDRSRVLNAQAALFSSGSLEHEYRVMHQDGRTIWINDRLVLIRDESGRPREIVGTWLDVTARVGAEQELQRLNRFYKVLSLVNETCARVREEQVLFDEVCRIAVTEGDLLMAWVGLFDASRGEVMPVARHGHDAGYLEFLATQGVFRHDGPTARSIRDNTSYINNDMAGNALMGPWREEAMRRGYRASAAFPLRRNGVAVGAVSLYSNISNSFTVELVELFERLADDVSFALDFIEQDKRRRLAEVRLEHLNERLEQRVAERTRMLEAANKELEAFSYSVSHDLRAPLRSIDGFSQLLVKKLGEGLDATSLDYLRRVRRASQRMDELIHDLLKLSKVSRVELNKERVDLSAIAREIADGLRATAPMRAVEFEIEAGIEVQADGRLMRAVLENLLGNAWKFTARRDAARIEFGRREDEGRPVYFVRDNGAGFDMEYAGKLFGAFQRLHKPEEFEGTGIGLATVQRIVNRHGGSIWATAEVGKGATFCFTLD